MNSQGGKNKEHYVNLKSHEEFVEAARTCHARVIYLEKLLRSLMKVDTCPKSGAQSGRVASKAIIHDLW